MPDTFAPPTQPSFPIDVDHIFRGLKTEFDGGYVETRHVWPREKRRWTLLWGNASQATRDYVVGFVQKQIGLATSFYWLLPVAAIYQPRPAIAPTLSYVSGGALAQRTIYVVFTYLSANGETQASPRDSITVPASNLLRVTVPRFPAGFTRARVYASTVSGSEARQSPDITASQGSYTEPAGGIGGTGPTAGTTNTASENVLVHASQGRVKEMETSPGIFDMELVIEELFA